MAHDQQQYDTTDDDARLEDLYNEICSIGRSILGNTEGPEEWPNLVEEWLLEHRPDVLERGVNEDDVAAAFEAWEIGR
jgi:hypothetical protein